MPMYRCQQCGCAENTALGFYWLTDRESYPEEYRRKRLCSEHGPTHYASGVPTKFGKWHGDFEQKPATGYLVTDHGFIWKTAEFIPIHEQILGRYREDGTIEPLTEADIELIATQKEARKQRILELSKPPIKNPWVSLSNKKSKQKKQQKRGK